MKTQIKIFLSKVIWYSGIVHLLGKINSSKWDRDKKAPTFSLWFIAFYFTIFSFSNERYLSNIELYESRKENILIRFPEKISLLLIRNLNEINNIYPKPTMLNIIKLIYFRQPTHKDDGLEKEINNYFDNYKYQFNNKNYSTIDFSIYRKNYSNFNFESSDLSMASFEFCDLSNTNFLNVIGKNIYFYGSNLSFSQLADSDLEGAVLSKSFLYRTDFKGTNLMKSDFTDVASPRPKGVTASFKETFLEVRNTFENSSLNEATFKNSKIPNTKFDKADFSGVTIQNSDFNMGSFKDLTIWYSKVENSDLSKSNFDLSNLIGTDFLNTDFSNSNFKYTVIADCDFGSSKFNNVVFDWVILYNADLSLTTGLKQEDLYNAIIFDNCKFPDNIDPYRYGNVFNSFDGLVDFFGYDEILKNRLERLINYTGNN